MLTEFITLDQQCDMLQQLMNKLPMLDNLMLVSPFQKSMFTIIFSLVLMTSNVHSMFICIIMVLYPYKNVLDATSIMVL